MEISFLIELYGVLKPIEKKFLFDIPLKRVAKKFELGGLIKESNKLNCLLQFIKIQNGRK